MSTRASPLAAPARVDLTNCDREPIHIPGSIQPHGAMLVCGPEFTTLQASANAASFLGLEGQDLTGRALSEIVGQQASHAIRNTIAKSSAPNSPGLLFRQKIAGLIEPVDVAAHTQEDRSFVEFEPASDDVDTHGPLEITRALVRRLADETTLQGLAAAAARMIAVMLGYDRVMVYKLLHNGAGRVIAERKRADLASFLGLHFPASDIPAQARELYRRNWIRMISDVRYSPIPVLPPVAPGEPPLDMSYAQLRSVSPIHCEYLQNMGVSASMSISVVVEGQLWGLIACHHYSPKVVPLPQRVGAELFGQYFSLQVEAMERRNNFEIAQTARARLDRIVAGLPPEDTLIEALTPRLDDLSLLVPCEGAGLWVEGQWLASGLTPQPRQIADLMGHLDANADGKVWRSSQLGAEIESFAGSDIGGVLAIPVSRSPRDYLVYFRNEESRSVDWAGEPEKDVGPLGDRLTPRKSFDLWRQEVRGQSTPWTEGDLAIAEAVQNYLRDVVLRHTEATAEERQRTEARRRLVNEELNHRVKNILALTKAIVEQSRKRAGSLDEFADAVHGRLAALAFAHDQITRDEGGGDLRRLLEAELAAHGGESSGRAHLDGPDVRLAGKAFQSLAMIAHELTTNAAKYGALSKDSGSVAISWSIEPGGDCVLTWTETGGPPVKPPERAGFGSTLIAQVVPFDLEGESDIQYPPTGLVARFRIPMRHVVHIRERDGQGRADAARSASANLAGKRVLLVEDQVLIALDAEHSLRQLGAAQVVIVPSAEAAARRMKETPPDFAVLDVNLGDGTSIRFAEDLVAKGVPFVFATGYGDTIMIPEPLKSVPIVRKPYGPAALAQAVGEALARKGAN